MDFIEGLPLSNGHDMILVVVCHLTKMALFIPTFQDIDAEDLAHIFLLQVFAKHGTPTDIFSDHGKHFISCFGDRSASCSVSGPISQWPITQKPMGRPNESTRSWNNILGYTSTTSSTTGSTFCPL